MKIKILILLLILSSCEKGINEDELIAIEELSILKEWIEINSKNQDTLYWGDLGKLTGLNVKLINPERANLEFISSDSLNKYLIYYQNNKFSVYELKKQSDIENVNYIIE